MINRYPFSPTMREVQFCNSLPLVLNAVSRNNLYMFSHGWKMSLHTCQRQRDLFPHRATKKCFFFPSFSLSRVQKMRCFVLVLFLSFFTFFFPPSFLSFRAQSFGSFLLSQGSAVSRGSPSSPLCRWNAPGERELCRVCSMWAWAPRFGFIPK